MSRKSIVRARTVRWTDEFDAFGYEIEYAPAEQLAPGEVRMRARRPTTYGGPPTTIDVREVWAAGGDPDGLGLAQEGCYLARSRWHGQITPTGDTGADRLDVLREAKNYPAIHRHPFDHVNDVRIQAAPLAAPEAWLEEVERIISTL